MKTLLVTLSIIGWPVAVAFAEAWGIIGEGLALLLMCAWALAGLVGGTWLLAPYLPRRRTFGYRQRRSDGVHDALSEITKRDRARPSPSDTPRGTNHLGRRVL